MNQKQLGIIVLIFSLLLGILFLFHYLNNLQNIAEFMRLSNGTCFNEQGECLHAKPDYVAFGGFAVAIFLLGLSIYLIFLDKTQRLLAEQHKEATHVLKKAEELAGTNEKKEKFNAFLEGFDEKRKLILKAIHEQEGIQQSTLKYRTGMSKTELSLLLKELEEKGIIMREDSGKTKKVYLKKVL
ncbi:MarR family transcriptional regulator [Candidatus Woesearchaeota archaeon]|nr:MarR family transcriptional regulator [Candidatus Woesearchaeota archaeon]